MKGYIRDSTGAIVIPIFPTDTQASLVGDYSLGKPKLPQKVVKTGWLGVSPPFSEERLAASVS